MLNKLKNDVISLCDTTLLYLKNYQDEIDISRSKSLKEITFEYHIFSCKIIDILERLDLITERISALVCAYDDENKFSDRDIANSLTEACTSFRKSFETYLNECNTALKQDSAIAVRSLIGNTDILTRKILFLKRSL